MKKFFALLLTLLFVISSFSACKKNELGAESNTDTDINGQISDGTGDVSSDIGDTDSEENKNDVDADNGAADGEGDNGEGNENTDAESKPAYVPKKESTSGLKFALNEDGQSYTLVGKGSCTATDIVIDGYKGLPVTKIGYAAFENDKKITKVTIGDGVKHIDMYAFSMCSAITSVSMGKGVEVIDIAAFRYCSALTAINIGSSVERIGDTAFYNSGKLNDINIPSSVKVIEAYAFDKTAYFKNESNWKNNVLYIGKCLYKAKTAISGKYTVADGTTVIAHEAFWGCESLTGIVIPNSVKTIGGKAFFKAKKLTSVTIGTGVERIGDEAFYNSGYYNASGNWKDNVLLIGDYVIKAKPELSGSYNIPAGTRAIADVAFGSCNKVTSVNIPESVVGIGDYAFNGCSSMTGITIGSGVKRIGENAFKGCVALKSASMKKASDWSVAWKSAGIDVSADSLSNKASAALLLTYEYYDLPWYRG